MSESLDPARDQLKYEAMRKLLLTLPLGFATGAGLRGLVGTQEFLSRNLSAPQLPARHDILQIPYPLPPEKKKQPRIKLAELRKRADANSYITRAAKTVTDALHLSRVLPEGAPAPAPGAPIPSRWGGQALGDYASKLRNIPWFVPGVAVGGLRAAATGYKLTDMALNHARKKETDSELSEAEKEYNRAVAGTEKTAAFAGLDELYDAYEKQARSLTDHVQDAAGLPLAGYLTLAGLLAVGSRIGMYHWAKQNDPKKLMAEAFKRRQQQLFAENSMPMIARLQPYEVPADEEQPPEHPTRMRKAAAGIFSGISSKIKAMGSHIGNEVSDQLNLGLARRRYAAAGQTAAETRWPPKDWRTAGKLTVDHGTIDRSAIGTGWRRDYAKNHAAAAMKQLIARRKRYLVGGLAAGGLAGIRQTSAIGDISPETEMLQPEQSAIDIASADNATVSHPDEHVPILPEPAPELAVPKLSIPASLLPRGGLPRGSGAIAPPGIGAQIGNHLQRYAPYYGAGLLGAGGLLALHNYLSRPKKDDEEKTAGEGPAVAANNILARMHQQAQARAAALQPPVKGQKPAAAAPAATPRPTSILTAAR